MTTTTDKMEPIPLDEVERGYYWAQFTGPLIIVKVQCVLEYGGALRVWIFGSDIPRLPMEFRFWQKIEAPNVPF